MSLYEICEFKENEVIIREGEISERLYMIEEGHATEYLYYSLPDEYLVSILKPGRFFGELGFLVKSKNTSTIVATTDLKVRMIRQENFKEYLSKFPQTGMDLLHHMAKSNTAMAKSLEMVNAELLNMIETIEAGKPVPIDLKKKLLEYRLSPYLK